MHSINLQCCREQIQREALMAQELRRKVKTEYSLTTRRVCEKVPLALHSQPGRCVRASLQLTQIPRRMRKSFLLAHTHSEEDVWELSVGSHYSSSVMLKCQDPLDRSSTLGIQECFYACVITRSVCVCASMCVCDLIYSYCYRHLLVPRFFPKMGCRSAKRPVRPNQHLLTRIAVLPGWICIKFCCIVFIFWQCIVSFPFTYSDLGLFARWDESCHVPMISPLTKTTTSIFENWLQVHTHEKCHPIKKAWYAFVWNRSSGSSWPQLFVLRLPLLLFSFLCWWGSYMPESRGYPIGKQKYHKARKISTSSLDNPTRAKVPNQAVHLQLQ